MMTLKQVRLRYRLSLLGMLLLMTPLLVVRYGAAWNVYANFFGVFGLGAVGVAIVWWGMRYGDMLDAHNAAVAAKRWPLKGADARAAAKAHATLASDATAADHHRQKA
jgi:hypothetical protein